MVRTVGRFVDFIEINIGKTNQSQNIFLERVDTISFEKIKEYKTAAIEAEQFLKGGMKAIELGAAGYTGATNAREFGRSCKYWNCNFRFEW